MKTLLKTAAGMAALALAGQAHAATWLVNYASTNGGAPFEADLTVSASDVLNAVGGFDVTGVTGNVDGDIVTGLIANPSQPLWSYSADGLFMIDNVMFANLPNISWYGLFFSGASGAEYNLFSDNASTYELYKAKSGVGYLAHSYGAVQVAQLPPPLGDHAGFDAQSPGVPEPAAWTMMILGFGGIGAVLRRRRMAPA